MTRESYLRAAEQQIARADQSADPEAYRQRWLHDLRTKALIAEEHAVSKERSLAEAVELMQRRESAERMAQRATHELGRLRREQRREVERLARNARSREAYRGAREATGPRVNGQAGMHAIAIAVSAEAYAAMKLDARRRVSSIPVVLGEIISNALTIPPVAVPAGGPKWQRTGEGRRASQHTRIRISDEAWEGLHGHAISANLTVGRWIGMAVEQWAIELSGGESLL